MRETTGDGTLNPLLRLIAGAGAGIVAMSATYPLDMVRGRLTVQEGRNVQYSGIWHATRTILKEVRGGWRMGNRQSVFD
jgi:solute carrier family 25 (mitochondrial phosphate transporter), member 23/24/25/41